MSEAFETAALFARQLIDGRGKDSAWTKRARALATAAYQAAQEEGKKAEPCEARTLELLCAPEAVLLARIGGSIAVSVSMQAKLFSRLSPQQRASLLSALNQAARTRLHPPEGGRTRLPGRLRAGFAGAPGIERGLPANDEGEGDAMSEAEFEA